MRGDESALLAAMCAAIRRSPWSLEEIAQQAHVSLATLYLWTAGTTRDPRIRTLEKVADALDYEIKLSRGRAMLVQRPNGAPKPKVPAWETWMRQGD